MDITEITVSWQETANLGNYSNVRPQIALKATVGPDDDPEAVRTALLHEARTFVHQAVDEALEAEGHVAKYSTEPRYDVLQVHYLHHFLLIVPTGTSLPNHRSWKRIGRARLAMAHRIANEQAADKDQTTQIIDCSTGDLTLALSLLDADRVAETARNEELERQRQEEWNRRKAAQIIQTTPVASEPADDDDDDEDDEDE